MKKPKIDWSSFEDSGTSVEYEDIVSSFGNVLVEVNEDDYSGSSWVLLKAKDNRFGYLTYSWGSCSGCDALEACDSIEEREELHSELWNSITWNKSLDKLLDIVRAEIKKDESWMQNSEQEDFAKQCESFLSQLVTESEKVK